MGKILLQNGYSFDGKDLRMSGTTGEMLPAYVLEDQIFISDLNIWFRTKCMQECVVDIPL
jgi:hypothetical protein